MNKRIKIKHTYNIKIKGNPLADIEVVENPDKIIVLPSLFPHIKPKLLAKVGDEVIVGSPLFINKNVPEMKFLSPAGGVIESINYGARRSLQEIVIKTDDVEKEERFKSLTIKEVQEIKRSDLVDLIVEGGLWQLFRIMPFNRIPALDAVQGDIYVTLDDNEPYTPSPVVYLKGKMDQLKFGLSILHKLTNHRVFVSVSQEYSPELPEIKGKITHVVSGKYPATKAGTIVYNNKKSAKENHAWTISGQDLLMMAELISTGRYPNRKVVVTAGSESGTNKHYNVRIGTPLSSFLDSKVSDNAVRLIRGGVFSGIQCDHNSAVGLQDNAYHMLKEDVQEEFLQFAMPGWNRPSIFNVFMSKMKQKNDWEFGTNIHGGVRGCIACGKCEKVCSVDILPDFLFKNILADDLEEALKLGMLDCTNCGLCSYVCPCKIEISTIITDAKDALAKELGVK